MTIIPSWPRMMSPELALVYVGGDKILRALNVKPRVRGKGLTRYDRLELDAALDSWKGFRDDEGAD